MSPFSGQLQLTTHRQTGILSLLLPACMTGLLTLRHSNQKPSHPGCLPCHQAPHSTAHFYNQIPLISPVFSLSTALHESLASALLNHFYFSIPQISGFQTAESYSSVCGFYIYLVQIISAHSSQSTVEIFFFKPPITPPRLSQLLFLSRSTNDIHASFITLMTKPRQSSPTCLEFHGNKAGVFQFIRPRAGTVTDAQLCSTLVLIKNGTVHLVRITLLDQVKVSRVLYKWNCKKRLWLEEMGLYKQIS